MFEDVQTNNSFSIYFMVFEKSFLEQVYDMMQVFNNHLLNFQTFFCRNDDMHDYPKVKQYPVAAIFK